ncbi:MAG: flagellar biosynthetic protein FliO [Opitutaceae bacterium]|nr:flagellar biosynthetic protein FliO [Verrucomicrobiales bacterium]
MNMIRFHCHNWVHRGLWAVLGFGSVLTVAAASPELTNQMSSVSPTVNTALPEVGLSLVRVFGALALVLALFFAGVWLFRNWQRLTIQRGRTPQLQILEMKSLGNRQAILVVAFQQQRMLLSSSPTGVTFLSHLPAGEAGEGTAEIVAAPTFGEALQQVLGRKA